MRCKIIIVGVWMLLSVITLVCSSCTTQTEQVISESPKIMVWANEPPEDCPFKQSDDIVGIAFTGRRSNYRVADTWYPSWAADGNLYSPWTDGEWRDAGGQRVRSSSDGYEPDNTTKRQATTGQAVMTGDDPVRLKLYNLGVEPADPYPYGGRYPCGSLVYNGVWYYATYCLAPHGITKDANGFAWNWPVLGPVPGFRISTDYGRTWMPSPHTPEEPLFPEPVEFMGPVKIGAPHFVDFGKNMEHSPDGKAYLVGMGAEADDPMPRMANLSWISGDQIYICRVTPGVENINDESKYEYFAGYGRDGKAVWSWDFADIRPVVEWNNNMGCVTATYNAPLRKYLMCITDGWPTCGKMNSYVLEADKITGPYRLAFYMKEFGEQGYFLNFPSKFISSDGRTAWLCYSANFASDWNNRKIRENPPGSHYGLVLQQVVLLDSRMLRRLY